MYTKQHIVSSAAREKMLRSLSGMIAARMGVALLTREFSMKAEVESSRRELYQRLLTVGKNGSVKEILNDFFMEGKLARKLDLLSCMKQLRKHHHHHHALEIVEWMSDRNLYFGRGHHAFRLHLIAKVQGIHTAEDYFAKLPPHLLNELTYGCLLNCYCEEQMAEKALQLFKKMDELQLLKSALPFNNLMTMHLKLKQPLEILGLVEQMRLRKIPMNQRTYNIRMMGFSSIDDIKGVQRVYHEMKVQKSKTDWTTYSSLASIYAKAGLLEKAEYALKGLEAKMRQSNREPYHFLISLYAAIEKPREVHRVWGLLKGNLQVATNKSYCVLIPALAKLNDMDGLKKCFQEWESSCSYYDVQVVNSFIRAFLRHSEHEEAKSVYEKAMERCDSKLLTVREMFMVYSLKNKNIDLALEHLGASLSICQTEGLEWRPKLQTLDAFSMYFEDEKNCDAAQKVSKLLELASVEPRASELLQNLCLAACG